MAFDIRSLDTTDSGSKGVGTLSAYETTDNKAAVNGAGYFNAAANELYRTAAILIKASDATYFAKVSISGNVVTLAAMDTFGP